MNLKKGYIELRHETGWKKPIQALRYLKIHGEIDVYRFFAEWDSFEEAKKWLMYKHGKYEIIINEQIMIGF